MQNMFGKTAQIQPALSLLPPHCDAHTAAYFAIYFNRTYLLTAVYIKITSLWNVTPLTSVSEKYTGSIVMLHMILISLYVNLVISLNSFQKVL
jgi:hypothetical protein